MSISSINYNQNNIVSKLSFKGNIQKTENGSPYYHSNSGLKIGSTLAGFVGSCVALAAVLNKVNESKLNNYKKNMSPEVYAESLNLLKYNKNNLKKIILPCAIASAVYIGCGAIIDGLRNNNAKKSADLVKKVGVKRAMAKDENIEISQNNRPYYYSDKSVKYGALLGAIAQVGLGLLDTQGAKNMSMAKISKTARYAGLAAIGAAGGAILGAWADHSSNKKADKMC